MAEQQLHVRVVTPRAEVLLDHFDAVTLPGHLGELQVLPNHRPLLTSLRPGRFVVRSGGGERTYYMAGGFAEILPDKIVVLADECILASDLDPGQASEDLAAAQARLDEKKGESFEETHYERLAVERARVRLSLSGGSASTHH
jgi:F-type H+-transporting ATPase subunit epsilon